jgi:zona occludens toxin
MAINAYTGLQGSGKSYEVVSEVILPAIHQGRRVVTNIDGIDQDKIHEYLVEKYNGVNPAKLGIIVHVTNDRILEPAFFPDEEKPEIDSVVKPGDLVAIDESWRFWAADGGKLSHEHMQFFRMHRHYIHPETFVTCDMVLMIQDISGLHRSVKNVVEFSFRTTKHKSLGLSKRYRVEVYEGYKQLRSHVTSRYQKEYNPAIFPLYKSYSGGNGTEQAIDDRINIFKRWWLIPLALVLSVGAFIAVTYLYHFFHPEAQGKKPSGSTSATSGPVSGIPASSLPKSPPAPSFSVQWRIAGQVAFDGEQYVLLAGPTGRLRYEHPSNFMNAGLAMVGKIDGDTITYYSGSLPPPNMGPQPGGLIK